mgnify:CR=1 FL=1
MFKLIVSFGVMSCMGFSSKIENLIEGFLNDIDHGYSDNSEYESGLGCNIYYGEAAEPVTPVL